MHHLFKLDLLRPVEHNISHRVSNVGTSIRETVSPTDLESEYLGAAAVYRSDLQHT